jgi:2-oxoglutarate decarboxylase
MSGSTSPFGQNEWLVEEMYRKFREDPFLGRFKLA